MYIAKGKFCSTLLQDMRCKVKVSFEYYFQVSISDWLVLFFSACYKQADVKQYKL